MRNVVAIVTALLAGAVAREVSAQEGDELVRRALEAEARQVEAIARVSPAVAAVFPGEVAGNGGGSGVVIDPAGYVLTNFHVSGLEKVQTVGLDDGKTYKARLLGIDPGGDIALLRLVAPAGKTFVAVPLGVSDEVRPGERVFAMGNPFLLAEDFKPTVTEGVVSGVHRYRDASGSSDLVYGDGIQIDASINPGNSGGPLFNARGELLGINGLGGFRPDRGRVNVGVGFAASIDQIKGFLLDLRAGRQCQHGTMNATVRDQEFDGGARTKPVVDAIGRESRAYAAGLRLGDVVRRFDGVPVTTQNQLLTMISRLPAGRRVTVDVERAREDNQGVHQVQATFRLDPLWSGPASGEWVPDPEVVKSETALFLAKHRAGRPPAEWSLEAGWKRPDGAVERRTLRVRGRQLRVERQEAAGVVAEVWDGERGWRVGPSGGEEPLPAAKRDVLAGTAEALFAVATEGAEAKLPQCELAGGEWLAGRMVAKLEVKDRAGRRRLVYLDPATGALAGLAYQDESNVWVEEAWVRAGDRLDLVRVDFDSGAEREKATGATLTAGPQDPALFKRAGQ